MSDAPYLWAFKDSGTFIMVSTGRQLCFVGDGLGVWQQRLTGGKVVMKSSNGYAWQAQKYTKYATVGPGK